MGRRRSIRRWAWIGAGAVVALLIAIAVFLQSATFQEMVRRRLVAAMEKATGARIELQQFSLEPSRLQIGLRGLTVRGRESQQEPPLFTAELVEAGWKVLSFWSLRADLRSLRIWNPRFYVAVYEDGSNNLPLQAGRNAADRNWIEQVWALRVQRLEVLRGHLRLQSSYGDKQFPLDFRAENFHLAVNYEARAGRYSGMLDFQKAVLARSGGGPLMPSGRVKFALYPQKAQIESLELKTAGSRVFVEGTLDNFRSPRLQFRYDLLLDWKEAGEFLGSPGWKGQMSWQGQGSYAEQEWQLQGALAMRAAGVGVRSLPAVPWSGRAALLLRGGDGKRLPWRAELKDINVTVLGGRFSGGATVEMAAAPTTHLDLQTDHISVAALYEAIRETPGAVPRLRPQWTQWTGSISGPTQISFVGAGNNLVLRTDWRVEPSPVVPPGFTPVSGVLRANYYAAQQRFESEGSYLNVGETRLSADGWLDSRDSRLSVSIDAPRFEDARPLLELLWKDSAQLPIAVHGRAKTGFQWVGGQASPRINGNFQVSDFDYQDLRWDDFSGRFDLHRVAAAPSVSGQRSQRNLPASNVASLEISSGKLLRGRSAIEFNATLELTNGTFTSHSPFSVAGSLRDMKLEDLQKLLGAVYPVQLPTTPPVRGTLQGSFQVSGTRADARGKGNIELIAGEAYGETFTRLTAQLALESGALVSARQLRVQKGTGVIEGEGSVGLVSKQYRFSLAASNMAIESFEFLRGRLPATGLMQARLTGAGNLGQPAIQGQIEISRLAMAGQQNGELSIGIDASEGQAKLRWTGNLFRSGFRGSGAVQLQGLFPFSAQLDFSNMDVVSLLRTVREVPTSLQATVGGMMKLDGTLKNASTIRATGELGTLAGSAGPVEFRNAQPVRFGYENGAVKLERLHLIANNTDLEAAGTVSLARNQAMDLAIKGRVDLAAFNAWDPDLSSSGQVSLDAVLNGTLQKPLWRGRLDFSDASLRYGSFPNGLSSLHGRLVFEGNRAMLENFEAESGGGSVKFGGMLTYLPDSSLGMQITAELADVRVRYPEGVSTWLDGRLTLSGSPKATTVAGKLVITKETANPEFDIGAALTSHADQPLVRVKSAALRNLRLDLQIVSAPNVSLETTTAKNLRGNVDLRIQGSLEHPSWLGRISVLQGEVTIGGRRYLADRGELTFSNPFRIEPTLNLQVRARVEQYDIRLNFSGPLEHLIITYSSDPPLPTSEILSLLVAGNAYATSLQPSNAGTSSQLGASSLLSQALSEQMSNRLDRIFGSGHVRINPQLAGFDRPANATVALEQHVTDNLTLLYVTNVTSAQQQIIQAELTLSPRFSVTATRDQNGLVGVNFQISLRFR